MTVSLCWILTIFYVEDGNYWLYVLKTANQRYTQLLEHGAHFGKEKKFKKAKKNIQIKAVNIL